MSFLDDINDLSKQRRNFILVTSILIIVWYIPIDLNEIKLPFYNERSAVNADKLQITLWGLWLYFFYRFSTLTLESNISFSKAFRRQQTIALYKSYISFDPDEENDVYDSLGRYDTNKMRIDKDYLARTYNNRNEYFILTINKDKKTHFSIKKMEFFRIKTKAFFSLLFSTEFAEFAVPYIWAGIAIIVYLPKLFN